MTSPTIADLIAKKQELQAYLDAEQEKFDAVMKPYKEAIRAIQGACCVALLEQGLQNFKSDSGTAYLKHSDGLKVDNKQAFLQFVRAKDRFDMLDIGLLVDPVRAYRDANNDVLPDGISSTPSVTCIIRR